MVVVPLRDTFVGDGRCRQKRESKTRSPAHYQLARWEHDDGKRIAVPVGGVSRDKRAEYPLISTAVRNPTGTETLIWLHFDLDYKRADKCWAVDGRLHWPTIAATLGAHAPELIRYLTAICKSSGGQGLSLVLSISPLELIDETGDVQKLAYRLQSWVIRILNFYGMGADEGARGLKRLMPNIFQATRLIDRDEMTEAIVQIKRPRVIQNLLYHLRFHPALRPVAKRDRVDILWGDRRVELPCARLYTDLLDSVGPWGTEQLRAQDIIDRYKMSKNTAYKFLNDPPPWLEVEKIAGEGFRLTIRPSRAMSDRAYLLLEQGGDGKRANSFPTFSTALIRPPESVNGSRNGWLVSVILAAKWKGIPRAKLMDALRSLVKRVPSYQSSRSLTRELQAIARSLYHHRSNRIGEDSDLVLPTWLIEALSALDKPKQLSQTFTMKGTCVAGFQAGATRAAGGRGSAGVSKTAASAPRASGFPTAKGRARPGVRGGPAPCTGGETGKPAAKPIAGVEGDAGRKPAAVSSPPAGNTDCPPSGAALRSAFSRALLRAPMSAAEKGRVLDEISSLASGERDAAMIAWLDRMR